MASLEDGDSVRTSAAPSAAANAPIETDSGVASLLRGEICDADLPKTVTALRGPNGAKVYLVGTAHFSPQSCDDVVTTIKLCRPDILMVEICESRSILLQLTEEEMNAEANTNASLELMWRFIEARGVLLGTFQYLLALLTQRISARLGRMAGGEFRAGYQESKKISFCRVHLGDRPLEVTLKRLLARLSFFEKIRLFFHIIQSEINVTPESVEEYKNKDLLEQLLADLGKQFPTLVEVLVNERDRYMAYQLQCLCREQSMRPYGERNVDFDEAPVIVAVVGLGHVKGISQCFHDKITDIREISSLPPIQQPSRAWRYFKRGLFYSIVFYGTYRIGRVVVPSVAIGWARTQFAALPRPYHH